MASNINTTFPVAGTPTTTSVRNNFATLKSEIEAIQAAGFGGSGSGAVQPLTIKNEFGAYTIQASDVNNNTMIRIDSPLDVNVNVTIPNNTDMPCPIGSKFLLSTADYGFVTVVGAAGVVIASPQFTTIDRRTGRVLVIKTAENFWEIDGQLSQSSEPTGP